jgi:hypothetical protein
MVDPEGAMCQRMRYSEFSWHWFVIIHPLERLNRQEGYLLTMQLVSSSKRSYRIQNSVMTAI